MILLSAVLVLVALVLLLYGVIASDGVFVIWLSIAASVAAGLLLVWGILEQRRRIAAAATDTVPPATDTGPVTPPTPEVAPPPQATASTAEAAETADTGVVPPAAETAVERVAAHDSAPVVSVDAEPAPVSTPPLEPPAQIEEPEEAGGSGATGETPATTEAVAPSPPLGSVAPGEIGVPGDLGASPLWSVDASHVLVLAGRPRYHVPGCRFLDGRDDIEVMRLDDARAQGYTPCSVCRA